MIPFSTLKISSSRPAYAARRRPWGYAEKEEIVQKRWILLVVVALVLSACGAQAPTFDVNDPLSAWDNLKKAVAATDDKAEQDALVATFLKTYPTSPLVKGDTALFLVERPSAGSVLLTGDMTNWFTTIPMERVGQTGLWGVTQRFSETARLDYKFGEGGGGGIFNDPRNPLLSPSGFGRNSELRMPAYVPPTEILTRAGVPEGTIDALGVYSSTLSPTSHDLNVYLPAGYDPARRYPSVYFQDGDDYLRFANTPTILDNAIADGTLPPLIAVFVTPSEEQGRQTDYDLNDPYAAFFAKELVPLIDAKYSTDPDPARRVVVGDSYGGLISLYIGLLYPDVFGGVYNQSGFVGRHGGKIITLMTVQPPTSLRIATVVGTFETCIGGPVTEDECNFLEGNRTLRDVLESRGITLNYAEYPQGHAWGFWRDYIDHELAWVLNWNQ